MPLSFDARKINTRLITELKWHYLLWYHLEDTYKFIAQEFPEIKDNESAVPYHSYDNLRSYKELEERHS